MPQSPEFTPMTEAEIHASAVGDAKPSSGPIHLQDYDPEWPLLFEREHERICRALGERALLVEHVGSTSVTGLAAKPVIDIVLVVASSADEQTYVPELENAGYVLRIREPEWNEHRVLQGPDTNVNLHVFSQGCPEVDRMLLFRDRLRRSEADRERYELAKRELAQQNWKYVQYYADAKTAVVREIIARAERDT